MKDGYNKAVQNQQGIKDPVLGGDKRVPVAFRFDGLNWDFIKMLAEIAFCAGEKYGSAEQYATSRLDGEKSPANHIAEHLRMYLTGEPHDHFKDRIYHLAAIAYNAMMEAFYLRRFGRRISVLNLRQLALVQSEEVVGAINIGSGLRVESVIDQGYRHSSELRELCARQKNEREGS